MTAILWLRRDLRCADHPALAAAAQDGAVLPVYVHDPRLPAATGDRPLRHLAASLALLHDSTEGSLVVRSGDPAEVLADLADDAAARRVHVTADLTPGGRARDAEIARRLAGRGIELVPSGTPYAVVPGTVLTGAGTPYQVFTPFSRAWRAAHVPAPAPQPPVRWHGSAPAPPVEGRAAAGERVALARWREFLDNDLAQYAEERDRPDLDTTSRMSAHLAWGEVHPRTLLADLAAHPAAGSPGAERFVGELCWREFCADVLWHHPESAWADLHPGAAPGASAVGDGPDVAAWRVGRTGFPLVDAGMRQLMAVGWMHNRVRMAAASFLVKDLHVAWQVGARHFLDHLVDGDLASNNGNWQWVAGTGTDAAPYFRIFNPVRQSLRFDPDGLYVRRWIPELAYLDGRAAHEPWRHPEGYAGGYPERIVDHDEERRESLARYEHLRSGR